MKKALLVLLLLTPFYLIAQDYVDILKVGYSQNFDSKYESYSETTDIKSIDVDFTYPVVINKYNALITGFMYSRNNLELFPQLNQTQGPTSPFRYSDNISLHTTILKLGLATTFSDKWSGTFALLPKLASDYIDISNDDFYLGGVAILKYQKHERLKYRAGIFAIDQAYGWFTTPILGFYYISKNSKFEMDVSAPVSADINYTISPSVTLGFDYLGIGRSFDVHQENTPDYYVDYGALEFTCYVQYAFLENNVLLRAKAGYADFDAEAYADGDDVGFRVSAFNIGAGDRTQLNPELSSGFFGKIEAVYRFSFSVNKDD
ncbi:DUF6268 family outer membrane beta-barrel protein [Patiriisocius marinus]|uniref:DUF6268 family outer membrane beta-barrel protein n=1 Tax=Patiriisocius marinus TaxID=1397112 RepID=UPI0023303CFA|nr:DUF6268 family outer membrane beta-barrel protein [Patiriisocius marinus]